MSIKSKFISDVQTRTNIKLAGFAEMKPYLTNALLGGSALSLFTAIPALLHSYSNDEDALKTLAEVTKYSMPIGAVLGAGATGANQLSSAFKDTLVNLGNKLSDTAVSLGNNAVDITRNLGGAISGKVEPIVTETSDLLNSLKSLPADITYTLFG